MWYSLEMKVNQLILNETTHRMKLTFGICYATYCTLFTFGVAGYRCIPVPQDKVGRLIQRRGTGVRTAAQTRAAHRHEVEFNEYNNDR